jgi:hypothetical protein
VNVKSFIQDLIENNERLLKILAIALIAFLILRSCFSVSKDSLPHEVHETINSRYGSCVEVKGSALREGDNPQRVCTELTTNVLGQGTIPQQDQADGITEAICFRVLIEKPYFWALSHTQYEEITSFTRIASKVAVLQKGEWIVYPDQYIQDSERWTAYACPGEFDITVEEWVEEY